MSVDDKELLDKVESLLNLNIGDTQRLLHIQKTLQSKKQLYLSDKNYLDNLLRKTDLIDSKTNVEQSSEPPKEIRQVNSDIPETSQSLEIPSKLWYVGHIFFWIITGLICYILWKDKNEKMAKKHLIYSIPLGFVLYAFAFIVAVVGQLAFLI